jgi:hypothetical protein
MAEQRNVVDDSGDPSGDMKEPRDGKAERDKVRRSKRCGQAISSHTGLRYLSKLFRFMAVIMLLLLVAEVATGIYTQGPRRFRRFSGRRAA